jgi:GT2 family glycosyltransferase
VKVSVLLSLYRCEKYLEKYFLNAIEQLRVKEIEFSIVHNDPTLKEKEIIKKFQKKLNIVYLEVERESLYTSWNKAIKQSKGEYLVCWNVDDLRTKSSLHKMIETLDNNKNTGFTYGDFLIVKQFNTTNGKYIETPSFTFNLGTSAAICGPFFMWRRKLISKVGYFDEQFKSGGDFDFSVRLSIFSKGEKTNGLLGYFLNDNSGLSTKNFNLQILEREVILRRYGIWNQTNLFLNKKISKYHINKVTEFNKIREIDDEIINLFNSRLKNKWFIYISSLREGIIQLLRTLKRFVYDFRN